MVRRPARFQNFQVWRFTRFGDLEGLETLKVWRPSWLGDLEGLETFKV